MIVKRLECQLYSSNIFVLEDMQSDFIWLVDIGEKGLIVADGKKVKGLFITHTHIDHIQGINDLLVQYPDCVIYTTKEGKRGLYDDKINLTFYHEEPLKFIGGNVQIVKEGERVPLFEGVEMEFIETPGHHPSCLCFKAANYLFTGDSLIPKVPVVTKLKGGNKMQAEESKKRLGAMINERITLCPGHGDCING